MPTWPKSWLDAPEHRAWLLRGLVGACVVLGLIDVLDLTPRTRHAGLEFLDMPAFFAIFAFGVTIAVAQGGYGLRRHLARDEEEDAHG